MYVVNAAKTGRGISVAGNVSKPDDGLLDLFILDDKNLKTLASAAERVVHLNTETAQSFIKQGKEISIDTYPDQPVWTDGEYAGRAPFPVNRARDTQGIGPPGLMLAFQRPRPENALSLNGFSPVTSCVLTSNDILPEIASGKQSPFVRH